MKKIIFTLVLTLGLSTQLVLAQTPKLKVGTNPTNIDQSAALEVQSSNKGFLPPRMNLNKITAIDSPAEGLSVYCTDCSPKALLSFDGTNWVNANGQQPIAPPSAPTAPVATAGAGSASVAFTAPTSTGSGAIVSYTVISFPGGRTATGTASPIVVGNLTAGTAYTFTVRATNESGLTATSVQSNSVTPTAGVPQAPTALVATSTLGQSASIAFTAPTNNGGSPITGYTVTSSPGGITASGTTSPIVVNGLTNGTAYTFTMVATNAQGNSVASSASNSVTPQASVAAAPTIGTTTISGTTASVAFTAPTNNGGAAITQYTVTSSPGGITASGTTSPIAVPGLLVGMTYTFTVTATNSAGISVSSAASNSVTAAGAPSAPGSVTAIAINNTSASVSFTTPSANGSSISNYTITPTPTTTPATFTGTSSPITVTGLTTGTAYAFSVVANSSNGSSAAGVSAIFTPQNQVPGAPTSVSATAGNAQATITFTAPTDNGGAAITGYTVTSNSTPAITATGTSSPITVTGLTNGTSYSFTVVATNSVGNSTPSASSNTVIPVTAGTTLAAVQSSVSQAPLASYSLRKLNSSYFGSAIRVRRSNDNTEQNIGFTASGDLDESALTTFVGSNDGFVTVWYDQSGNNRNATNTTTTTQPRIVTAGVVNKKGNNNRASIAFNASVLQTNLVASYNDLSLTAAASINSTTAWGDIATYKEIATSTGNSNYFRFDTNGRNTISRLGSAWTPFSSTNESLTNLVVATAQFHANNIGLLTLGGSPVRTGTLSSTTISTGNLLRIGRNTDSDGILNGNVSELLVYKATDLMQTSRAAVEANLVTYYGSTIPASNTILSAPVAPSNISAVAFNASANVSFNAVSGATSYTVTSSPGNITATGTTTPIQVTGLTNGTGYTFTVVANNTVGSSSPSAASNSVTPAANASGQTVANAPSIGTATAGNLSASVSFSAPSSNGNSSITGYTVTSNPGDKTATGTTSPITVSGLSANTAYTFTVVANNSVGSSNPSSASNSVTVYTVPGQPVIGSISTFGLTASVPVTVNNNGATITNYTATVNPGNIVVNSAAAAIPVTLTASGTYTVTVTATNAAGTSVASSSSSFTVSSITSPQLASNVTINDNSGQSFASISGVDPNELISVGGTCPTSVTWQGVTYPTVNIGGQCWTARNSRAVPSTSGLLYTFYLDATDETSKQEGLFYTWQAAMDGATANRSQGVCPTGWHVPSLAEANYMIFSVGSTAGSISTASGPAEVQNALIKTSESSLATNTTGFNVILTGYKLENNWGNLGSGFLYVGNSGYFWNSTQSNTDVNLAYRFIIVPLNTGASSEIFTTRTKNRGHSVRCLKN